MDNEDVVNGVLLVQPSIIEDVDPEVVAGGSKSMQVGAGGRRVVVNVGGS